MSDFKNKNPIEMYEDMKAGRVKLAKKNKDDGPAKLMNEYLAMLRVAFMTHQHSHWLGSGYGNHIMFERLYDETKDLVDQAAEKIIGAYGADSLNHEKQCELMSGFNKYTTSSHIDNSLNVCKDFCELAEDVHTRLKSMEELSLGMDDMIQSHANTVESHIYLIERIKG